MISPVNRILLPTIILLVSCSQQPTSPSSDGDTHVEVPAGDPEFTPLGRYWVVDNAAVLSQETITTCDDILQQLSEDGVAEVVVLVQNGVKHPNEYATHYGRWLKLGTKGPGALGDNNSLVWMIRPDSDKKMTISVGRGLPEFTSTHYVDILEEAKDKIDHGDFDRGILAIVKGTARVLREVCRPKVPVTEGTGGQE